MARQAWVPERQPPVGVRPDLREAAEAVRDRIRDAASYFEMAVLEARIQGFTVDLDVTDVVGLIDVRTGQRVHPSLALTLDRAEWIESKAFLQHLAKPNIAVAVSVHLAGAKGDAP